jgi:class 3 adenylate cyclase/tetratricopeptide (TPR) repeat protein
MDLPPSVTDLSVRHEDETRLLTILFADLSSSVTSTAELDPEATAAFLDRVLAVMAEAVASHEGRIESYLGDGILAFFGTPIAHEDDPGRAIHTALQIRERLQAMGLDATAGIETGEVYLGRVGSTVHQEFGARGRVINLAARLQAKADRGQILVGNAAHRLTREEFEYAPVRLELKGIAGEVEAYSALRPRGHARKARGIEGLHAGLVGRDSELAKLRHAARVAATGRGQLVTIVAGPGVGKSRLVRELRRDIESGDAPATGLPRLWLEGRCLESGSATSYMPLIDMLREHLGLDDRVRNQGEGIRASVRQTTDGAELTSERASEIAALLSHTLSLDLSAAESQRIQATPPAQLRTEVISAIRDFLLALADQAPLVICVEDIHWADALSIEVVSALMDRLPTAPLLLICVSRPEPEHLWQRLQSVARAKCADAYVELQLGELESGEAQQLLRELLGSSLPEEIARPVMDRAQGNPFFLEEILRSLIESGVVTRRDGHWFIGKTSTAASVPDSVQSVILSRVDRLDAEAREVLRAASVIGRVFERDVLERLVPGVDVGRALWDLEGRKLIYAERIVPTERFSFQHVLTQETVYRSLLRARRRDLHQATAGTIEALNSTTLEAHYESLAYHYELGTLMRKAAEYLYLAGEKSRRAYLNEDAISYFERALECLAMCSHEQALDDDALRAMAARTREALGDVLDVTGRHEEAQGAFRVALELVPPNEPVWSARLERKAAKSLELQRLYAQALAGYDRAERALGTPRREDAEWQREWIQIQLERLFSNYFLARLDDHQQISEALRPVVEEFGTPDQRAAAYHQRCLRQLRESRFSNVSSQVLSDARAALEVTLPSGATGPIAWAYFIVGFTHLWREELEDAERNLSLAMHGAARVGDNAVQARAMAYRLFTARRRGDSATVKAQLDELVKLSEAGGMAEYLVMAGAMRSWLALREGDFVTTRALSEEALARWNEGRTKLGYVYPFHWLALWPLIAVEVEEDRLDEAIAHTQHLNAPEQQPPRPDVEELLAAAASAHERGDRSAVRQALQQAVLAGEALGYT